jgi:hypothetical protein
LEPLILPLAKGNKAGIDFAWIAFLLEQDRLNFYYLMDIAVASLLIIVLKHGSLKTEQLKP